MTPSSKSRKKKIDEMRTAGSVPVYMAFIPEEKQEQLAKYIKRLGGYYKPKVKKESEQ